MNYQKERDEFIATMTAEGLPVPEIRLMLRYASTLNRLAIAQCNGDWPADNGERKTEVCQDCGIGWVPSSFKRIPHITESKGGRTYYKRVCHDCRTSALVKANLPMGYTAVIGGDPRGCVLKIKVPSGRTNDWSREGICVPVRER